MENSASNQNSSNEYLFDYHKDRLDTDDKAMENSTSYQLEDYIIPISKSDFVKDSLLYKNDVSNNKSAFEYPTLNTSFGKVKFAADKNTSSDSYVDYSYLGFNQKNNFHVINIRLYEGERALLMNDKSYKYTILDGIPLFSNNAEDALVYKDQDGLSSYLAFYKIEDGSLNKYLSLSSDENIIDSAVWDHENNAVIKLRNLSDGSTKYYKIDSKGLNSHPQNSSSITSFTPKNYEILAKAEHDWNGDKIKDIVIVYDSIPAGKWEGMGKRPLLALKGVGNNQYQFWFRNDEAIPCRNCSGNADPTFEINQKDGFLKYSDISLISSTVKTIEYIFDNSLNFYLVNIDIEDSSNQPIKNRFTKKELGNIHLKSINIKNLENKLINSD
ncbi:hypothetical protein SAMN04488097_3683 [Epilithonimonas lactis]|nr:hypothetical protein SAMN04488097_3683 [Epilithonimonas lactis]